MKSGRLSCGPAMLLLAVMHLSTVAVLVALAGSRSDHPLLLDRYSIPLGSLLAVLAATLTLSTVCLVRRPMRYRSLLASVVERSGVLPELLLITSLFLSAFLLYVGGSLTPLMDRTLFSGGILTLLVSTALLPPALMQRARRSRFAGRIGGFLIGLAVALLIAEISLRLLVKSSAYHPSLDLRPGIRMEIRNDLPGVRPVCIHTTNSLGLRGDEPPSDWDSSFTILTVGGSTTHCFYMDDTTTWPFLLQEQLREGNHTVWVGNGGLNGHSTRGHRLFMREVVPRLDPDMVIVLCGVNDLVISFKSLRLIEGAGILGGLLKEMRERGLLSPPAEEISLADRLVASSVLLQVIERWKQFLFPEGMLITQHEAYRFTAIPFDSTKCPLPGDLRPLLPSLPEYASNIRTLIGLGRAAGVDMVFLTQPLLLEDAEPWRTLTNPEFHFSTTGTHFSCADYWRMLQVFNAKLLEICRQEDIPCFDLAVVLGHDPVYFVDEMHFSEAGTEEVARLVSVFLLEEGLVPTPDL